MRRKLRLDPQFCEISMPDPGHFELPEFAYYCTDPNMDAHNTEGQRQVIEAFASEILSYWIGKKLHSGLKSIKNSLFIS